jgi:hypothetical protein
VTLLLLLALWAGAEPSDENEGSAAMLRMGGFMLYYDNKGARSFVAMTPRDVPATAARLGVVRGRACQTGIAVPLGLSPRSSTLSAAAGDGGYEKALLKIKQRHPEATGIYDVKVDLHLRSVLGFFRRLCTEVTALGFKS